MNNAVGYLAIIHDAFPALRIAYATLGEPGQNNDVLVAWCSSGCAGAPGSHIFRFPRYPDVLPQLAAETAVLKALEGRLPMPVPFPSFVHLDGHPVGEAFVGYPRLPGAPLWPEIFSSVRADAVLDRLAGQLGGFLRALHTTGGSVIPVDLPRMETRTALQRFYARIQDRLFEPMRPEARAQVADLFERYLGDDRHFAYRPVLRHGDFGTSNILYDTALRRVTGIVDFGGIAWGDPAYDVAGLLASFGEDFVARCAEVYPEIQGYMPRARFHRDTFALEEALFGAEHGDAAAFNAGIAGYV